MIRLNVVCEGATEEEFIKTILYPQLQLFGVFPNPIPIGGGTSYDKLKNTIVRMLRSDQTAWVTTMIDLYGMGRRFPGYESSRHLQPYSKVAAIETQILLDIQQQENVDAKFIPYVQLHEFEALLFSEPTILEDSLRMNKRIDRGRFLQIRNQFENPEHINDDPMTSPSHRITDIVGNSYQKNVDGIIVALEIGLDRIRAECPHFHDWVGKLERLAVE